MSTSKHIDVICIVILLCTLLVTGLFMNGKALGIEVITDANTGDSQFTANDFNANWDTAGATQITLTGDGGSVKGNGAYVYNGDVHIIYAGKYVISGALTNGSIIVDADGDDKIWIFLNGVSLHCDDSAAIVVEQADKVFLTLTTGTENTVSSGTTFSEGAVSSKMDGAIYSRDDLTINGSGSLTVAAECKHGIVGNDDLVIVGGHLEITAAQDGIHANDSARFADVDITINAGDDGITVSNDDETAYIYMESGKISIPSCYEGIEAIDITIAGGVINICSTDDGINANGQGSNSVIRLTGGDITIINENGRDADGLDSNGSIDISGGNIFISVNASSCALDYVTENGGVCLISGGTVIAAGGSSMAEGFDSASEQAFLMYNTSTAASGTAVTLKSSAGMVLLSETVPCGFSSVVLSTPEMQLGEAVTLSIGDTEAQITVDNTSSGGFGMGGMPGGMFGGRDGRTDQSNGKRPSTGNEGITDNQQQDIPIIPDIETGRGEMPQIPSGDFKDGDTPQMPDRQEAGNRESIPPDSIDFGNIQKDNRSNGEWPAIPDGEGVTDAQPDSDRQRDFTGETQVPNQGREQNGMNGGKWGNRDQPIQREQDQDVSNEASAASPDMLILVGISILILLAGILVALKVKH